MNKGWRPGMLMTGVFRSMYREAARILEEEAHELPKRKERGSGTGGEPGSTASGGQTSNPS